MLQTFSHCEEGGTARGPHQFHNFTSSYSLLPQTQNLPSRASEAICTRGYEDRSWIP